MTDHHFNYGPRMNFEKLHQQRPHSTIIPSEYLDDKSSSSYPSDSLTSFTSSLGSHWKKVKSTAKDPSINSLPVSSIPSKPSSFSTYSNSGTLKSESFSGFNSGSDSSTTVNQKFSTDSSIATSLVERTVTREEKQCLSLQMLGLKELDKTLERSVDAFNDDYRSFKVKFNELSKQGKKTFNKLEDYVDCLEEDAEYSTEDVMAKAEYFMDSLNMILAQFRRKENIESHVRKFEESFESHSTMLQMMKDNKNRIARIQKKLKEVTKLEEQYPLTEFSHEDQRANEVYRAFVKMVRTLPFDEFEKSDMEYELHKIEMNPQMEGQFKCHLITRQLMATMDKWNGRGGSSTSLGSTEWVSVGSLKTPASASGSTARKNMMGSSSFTLSTLSELANDDSNLSDLDGALRTAKMRLAVEGPHNSIECSAESLHEPPMTLSSYEPNSSVGNSTLSSGQCQGIGSTTKQNHHSSVSAHSMPEKIFTPVTAISSSSVSQHTALSECDPVVVGPPRSSISKDVLQSAIGNRTTATDTSSLNFSNVSLVEMIDDALHTAKESVETQATTLLDSLQDSARKCGIALSDLMTAVSSSQESLSETQLTDNSIHH